MFLCVLFLVLANSVFATAGLNEQINFQGKVVNTNGTNVSNNNYSFEFNIYTAASGGSAVWTETKTLTVTDGIFRTALGDATTLPGSVDFNTDNIYLGITFNSDNEMSPRVRFTAVPQAFNADALDGVDSGSFLRSDTSDAFTSGTLTFNDSTVLAIGTGNDLQLTHDGTNSSITSATGNLTINNTNATGVTIAKLGTGTSATSFQIQNNSGTALLTINGAGTATLSAFSTNGGLLYTNGSGVLAQTGAGTSTTILHGGTTPSYSAVSLTADVSGTLPVANGGTGATSLTDLITLGTHTTGNYVASANTSILTGLTGGSSGSEGAALTLAFDYSQALTGDITLAANAAVFGASGMVYEGTTADTIETFIAVTDPTTSDKTITIPNLTGTIILSGHTFTGDVTATLGASNTTALTIAADSVTLATDTTGNYVGTITAGSGIATTGATTGEGIAHSISVSGIGPTNITDDVLDFIDLEDTLDLDAALTLNQTTNTWSQTFTGDTTTGLTYTANSLTTGIGIKAESSSLTTGKLVDIQVSGTAAAASQTALNILTAGATATNAITTYGAQISNTKTNATSGTNVALYLNASGATTANYGLIVNSGNVGIGTTSPFALVDVRGAGSFGRTSAYNSSLFAIDAFYNTNPSANTQVANGINAEIDTTNDSYASYQPIGVGATVRYRGSAAESASAKGARALDGSMFVYNTNTTQYASGLRIDARNLSTGTVTHLAGAWIPTMLNSGGGSVTNTYGFKVDAQTVGTNNYGFHSNIASASNAYNFYAAGTAQNYFASNVGIGDTSPDYLLELSSATSADSSFALSDGDVAHGLTTLGETDVYFLARPISSTAGGTKLEAFSDADAAALNIYGYIGSTDPTDTTAAVKIIGAKKNTTGVQDLGALETVFSIANNDDSAAFSITGNGHAAMGAAPTAASYLALTKNFTDPTANVQSFNINSVASTLTANNAFIIKGQNIGVRVDQNGFNHTDAAGLQGLNIAAYASGATGIVTGVVGNYVQVGNVAAGTVTNAYGVQIAAALNTGSGVLTNNNGFYVAAQTAGTNIYGFRGLIASASGRYNLYMDGTAQNYLAGNLGVGTTGPESKVQISGGGLCVGSDANCNTDNNTEGVVYSSATAMTLYDLAENYPTKDTTLQPTEIVALDPVRGVFVERARQGSSRLLGIISEKPSVLLGGFNGAQFANDRQVAVALSGRIPVKVNLEGGNVAIGDDLTVSSVPGVAKKAASHEPSIGYALGEYTGSGDTVMAFAKLGAASPIPGTPTVLGDSDGEEEETPDISEDSEVAVDVEALLTALELRVKVLEDAPVDDTVLTEEIFDNELTFLGPISFKGQLNIQSDVVITKELIVDAVTIVHSLSVQGDTEFIGEVSVSDKQAGFVKMLHGATSVEVTYEKELINTPVVQATAQGEVQSYWVSESTKKGFTLHMSEPVSEDVVFAWTALSSKEPVTTVSEPGPIEEDENEETNEDSPVEEPILSPSVSLESSPELSPTP